MKKKLLTYVERGTNCYSKIEKSTSESKSRMSQRYRIFLKDAFVLMLETINEIKFSLNLTFGMLDSNEWKRYQRTKRNELEN
jgi:hypothetical protein